MVAAVCGQCVGVQWMDCAVRAMTCRFGACCSSALNCPWRHSAEEIRIFKDEVELQKRKLAVRCGFCAWSGLQAREKGGGICWNEGQVGCLDRLGK